MSVDLTEEASLQRIAAIKELEKRQLQLRRRPRFSLPKLPTNLTQLNDADIMELLASLTKYQDYVAGVLVLIEIDEAAAKGRLEIAEAQFLVSSWTGASDAKVTISRAEAKIDPKVQKAKEELSTLEAKRKVYSIMEATLARDAAVVSREITRRTGSSGPTNRAERWHS